MRGILASGLVIATLALAGCTEDPEPRFSDPTETPSPSAPTTSAAADPEPWEEKSKAGAVAFAKHWVDVFNQAQATGDTTDLEKSSTSKCNTCNEYVSQLGRLYGAGGRFKSSGWRVLLAAPGPDPVRESAQINLRILRPEERVVDGNGQVKRFDGGKATYSAELAWVNGRWRMSRLVRFV